MKAKYIAFAALAVAALIVATSSWLTYRHMQKPAYKLPSALTNPPPRHPQPPARAPDFKFTDLQGNSHRLSDWTGRGDYVLINFWATWCGPCRKELPLLLELQKRYGGHGLQIIGPAIDQRAAVVRYVKRAGIKYPVFAGRDRVTELSTRFGDTVNAVPYSLLVAPDGRIVEDHAGRLHPAQIEAWMKHLRGNGDH